jgi:type III pantothenate kinase
MNVVIDFGNSAAKVGIFDHQNLMARHTFTTEEEVWRFLESTDITNIIVSSVKTSADKILARADRAQKAFSLDQDLPLPIKNLYKTPLTLGVDRLAGVCGAKQLFPFQNCLVIDAGTCITYDFLDKEGNYHGGAISPGMNMRFKAMNTFTARLPLVSPVDNPALIGDSTESCMQSGVIHGLVSELDGIITQYQAEFPHLRVILCGGDAVFFENKLKASIFASPELVLVGLNSILIYNVNR